MLEHRPIGEYVDSGESWNPALDDADGDFVYIDIASVDRGEKRIVGASRIPCRDAPSRARQRVRANDVLVSTVRPNLNAVAIVPDELDGATASTGFAVLRPRSGMLDARYLLHWVKAPQFIDEMVRQATGASYPAVSDKIVRNAELPVPSLAEQRRIAAILDKADSLCAKRREAIVKLDRLLESVFLDMFGDPNTEQNAADGSYELMPFLEVFADVSAGHCKTKQEDYLPAGKLPIVDQGQALIGGYTNDEGACSPIALPVIVFGDHTRCVKFVDFPFGVGADGVKVLRPRLDDVPVFLYWWLRLRRIPSAGYSRHYKFLKEASVRRPSAERQRRFADFVLEVNKRMSKLSEALARSEQLFLSLQGRAFMGAL